MAASLKIKVCGMRDEANIRQLAVLQPDYIGFIFYEKSKRCVEDLPTRALESLPAFTIRTGVFVDANYDSIAEKISAYGLRAVQLHGSESPDLCEKLRATGIEVIKAFGIDNEFNFSNLLPYNNTVDYFLFDTKTKLHGGSGELFDWQILNGYKLTKPYFLSGGLSESSLPEIKKLDDARLYAVDLNSRFEIEPGLKDINRLTSFFKEIRVSQ